MKKFKLNKKLKEVKGWCRNIAYNYNHNLDTNIYSQMVDMHKELNMEMDVFKKNWQKDIIGKKTTGKELFIIVTIDLP